VPAADDYRWWGRCPGSDPDETVETDAAASASDPAREGV